jgi:hypothetical protein
MYSLPVYGGRSALVDAEDHDRLCFYHWSYKPGPHNTQGYVVRFPEPKGILYLQREVMAPVPPRHEVIFVNHEHLDCRRSNLLVVTIVEARQRHRLRRDNACGYKGVQFHSNSGKWTATIRARDKVRHLGCFDNEVDAALAYDAAARRHHRHMAVLNFPDTAPAGDAAFLPEPDDDDDDFVPEPDQLELLPGPV